MKIWSNFSHAHENVFCHIFLSFLRNAETFVRSLSPTFMSHAMFYCRITIWIYLGEKLWEWERENMMNEEEEEEKSLKGWSLGKFNEKKFWIFYKKSLRNFPLKNLKKFPMKSLGNFHKKVLKNFHRKFLEIFP